MENKEIIARIKELRDHLLTDGGLSLADRIKACADLLTAHNELEEEQPVSRISTAEFFSVREKGVGRQSLNVAAVNLIATLEKEGRGATDEEKKVLAKFSGYGGGLIDPETGMKGSAYEYYTPKPIAQGVWDVMGQIGFRGGKVLDPSAGTGIFGATAPLSAAIDAVELSKQSGMVNKLVNDGPGYKTTISNFEKVAASTPDETYDAIVTNVPFGAAADRGMNRLDDPRYQDEPLENYFILRSLEKLRPNGLAAFIVPTRCISGRGGKPEELRRAASWMAEFVGAYRLPTGTFSSANTDTVTDIIFFRKYSEDAAQKILELREQSPSTLTEANVVWPDFIDGKYFDTAEGKKYVIGEFQAKDADKFRDVDKVIYSGDLNDIRNELKTKRPLPKSRINWELLETAETTPIVYHNGDTITQAGVTLKMVDGVWVQLPKSAPDVRIEALMGRALTPYTAFVSGLTYEEAKELREHLLTMSRANDIPDWLREFSDSWEAAGWNRAVVAMSVREVIADHTNEAGFNYLENFKDLSEALARANITKSTISKSRESLKVAMTLAYNHYNRKTKYSAFWRGDVRKDARSDETLAALNTPEARLSRLRYETRSEWLDIEKVKEIKGADFDPITDTEWCISADGKKICRTADYYVGNYADFLKKIDEEILAATDETVRGKLFRQKTDAAARVNKINVKAMKFNLFTPGIKPEEKVEFLKNVAGISDAFVTMDDGRVIVDIDVKNPKTDHDKLLNRLGDYLKKRTVTVGTVGWDFGRADERKELEAEIASAKKKGNVAVTAEKDLAALKSEQRKRALSELRTLVAETNAQFNVWVHANPDIMERLRQAAEDPAKLRFVAEDDASDISVPGMNPSLKLHGYQAAYVRQMGREFSGINGFGVGLGKTFTALAAVQHVQAIGAKKKTLFVVPNSVLSNWHKEAKRAYSGIDDCLFIGLREDAKTGKMSVNSNRYVEDLLTIKENRHSKIFMTMEAFTKIKIQQSTIDDYVEYMRSVDEEYERSESKKQDEANKGKLAKLIKEFIKPDNAAPSIEELGIDSIVMDEAHAYKNSAESHEFAPAKYLALSEASSRGLDAQIKCWYVRGTNTRRDGVLMLTATPITNSPLEIYSMLSLAVGADRVNDSAVYCKGPDSFLSSICKVDNQEGMSIAGEPRNESVFTGLENLEILRQSVNQVITVKNAQDVGAKVHIPEREEVATGVDLDPETLELLEMYKGAYIYARELNKMLANKTFDSEVIGDSGLKQKYEIVRDKFKEPPEIIGHPFNLIQKMTTAIADPEFDTRSSFYSCEGAEPEAVQKLIDAFNSLGDKKLKDEVRRLNPHTEEADILSVKTDAEDNPDSYEVRVRAYLTADGRVELTTLSPEIQSEFEKLADKQGITLGVTIPVKLAALLKNFQDEMAHPRGLISETEVSPIVKQIIFCDTLAMHNKIRRTISQKAGVPAGKIAIITGKTNNEPEQIIDVQDGFNAQGDENRYQCIIANEKAEVGINLQKGTQAIHHLTIGWTPDSLEQRNGRGARQGNATERVTIYYYDANGTFDQVKRTMVNHKSNWINSVLGGTDNEVDIEGGMTAEMQEKIALADGSKESIERIQREREEAEKAARIESNRFVQRTNLKTILSQRKYLADNASPKKSVGVCMAGIWGLSLQLKKIEKGIEADLKKQAAQKTIDKKRAAQKQLTEQIDDLCGKLDRSVKLKSVEYWQSTEITAKKLFENLLACGATDNKVREFLQALVDSWRSSAYIKHEQYSLEMIEGGEISTEWQAGQDTAKALIASAVEAYTSNADKEGAFPAAVASKIAESGGIVLGNGMPVVKGTIQIVREGAEVIAIRVADATEGDGAVPCGEWVKTSDRFNSLRVERIDLEAGEIALPGSPAYVDALREAAKIEDSHIPYTWFSDIAPEVLQYRTSAEQQAHNWKGNKLPAPYFPYALPPRWARHGKMYAEIVESQKKIINGWMRDNFYVDATVEITEDERSDGWVAICEALRDYALANGRKLSINELYDSDISHAFREVFRSALDAGNLDLEAKVTATNENDAKQQVADAMSEAAPWVLVTADDILTSRLEYLLTDDMGEKIKRLIQFASLRGFKEDDVGFIHGYVNHWKWEIMAAANHLGDDMSFQIDGNNWRCRFKTWKYLVESERYISNQCTFSDSKTGE